MISSETLVELRQYIIKNGISENDRWILMEYIKSVDAHEASFDWESGKETTVLSDIFLSKLPNYESETELVNILIDYDYTKEVDFVDIFLELTGIDYDFPLWEAQEPLKEKAIAGVQFQMKVVLIISIISIVLGILMTYYIVNNGYYSDIFLTLPCVACLCWGIYSLIVSTRSLISHSLKIR